MSSGTVRRRALMVVAMWVSAVAEYRGESGHSLESLGIIGSDSLGGLGYSTLLEAWAETTVGLRVFTSA